MNKKYLINYFKKEYSDYNIEERIIENFIKNIYVTNITDKELINLVYLKIDSYIAENMYKKNYYDIIKRKNEGLTILLERGLKIEIENIQQIYEFAIDDLLTYYNSQKSLSINIFMKMKKILVNSKLNKQTTYEKENKMKEDFAPALSLNKRIKPTAQKVMRNISFMKNNMTKFNITRIKLAKIINIDSKIIELYLNGERLLPDETLIPLYNIFYAKDFDEFKERVITYRPRNVLKKRNLSFITDLSILDLTEEEFSKLIGFEKSKVGSILNGEILLYDYSLVNLYKKLKVKNYKGLKKFIYYRKDSFDISFLKYKISENDLAEIFNVSKSTASKYLNKEARVPHFQIKKLFERYNCKDCIELDKVLGYNVSFLRGQVDEAELASIIDVSEEKAIEYLKGTNTISNDEFCKLLIHYGCKNCSELEEKFHFEVDNTKYDLSFLKNMISREELSSIFGISKSQASKYLNGITKAKIDRVNKLLDHYGYKTIEEFKEYLTFDLSFLNGKVPHRIIAEILGVTKTEVTNYLNNIVKMPKVYRDKLLKHYKCTTMPEFKELFNYEVDFDISFLSGYISSSKLASIVQVSRSSATEYLNGNVRIKRDRFKLLLKEYGCKNETELQEMFNYEIDNKTFDISYLHNYVASIKLAIIIGCSQSSASEYLIGKREINSEKFNKLLESLGYKTEEELIKNYKTEDFKNKIEKTSKNDKVLELKKETIISNNEEIKSSNVTNYPKKSLILEIQAK